MLNLTGHLVSEGVPFLIGLLFVVTILAFGLRTTLLPPSTEFSRRHEELRKET